MAWRKWLVRCLVFSVVGGCAIAVAVYQRWTDPAAVRQQVIERLEQLFPNAAVSLESARLRILGGIVLTELRLTRRDDPDRAEILHVPSAVVYHDKEHLLDGKIAFRKIELHRPHLRLRRDREGRWNVAGLGGEKTGAEPIPTLVISQGTVTLDDRLALAGTPPLEVTDVNLTLINDPVTTVSFDAAGASEALGALELRGTWQHDSNAIVLSAQATGIPLGPVLIQRLAACCPDKGLAPFPLEGQADVRAKVTYQPDGGLPLSYDVTCQVRRAKLTHPRIPLPLEGLEASLRCANGRVTVERLTASSGKATRVEVLHGVALLPRPEENFEAVVAVKHLDLCPALFEQLPVPLQQLAAVFEPTGAAGVTVHARRQQGQWLRHLYTVYPEGVRVCFKHFPYPADRITGALDYDHLQRLTRVNVRGAAGGQPLTLQGYWRGGLEDADARLDLAVRGLAVDPFLRQVLEKALPKETWETVRTFQLAGRCNAQARITHAPGADGFPSSYHVQFYDTAVQWEDFRYPLEKVTGFLEIYPDRWEARDLRGTHNGGEVVVRGRSFPVPPGQRNPDPRLLIDIAGRDIALDGDLRKAVEPRAGLLKVWDTFSPTGRLNFTARIDRPPGQPEHDLDITLDVRGCSVEPTFFRYALHDLTGTFRYHRDRVDVTGVTARHNDTRLSLARATVDLYPGGGFYADLEDLRGNPVLPDAEFLAALPEALRAACQGLKVQDPFAVRTRLVAAQAGDAAAPDLYWDGRLWLHEAKLEIGVGLEGVTGEVGCRGRYNGRQLQGLLGNVELEKGTVLGQPFHDLHARLTIKEADPDVLAVELARAGAFGGDVSGQARVDFHSDLRFELNLTAAQIRLEEFGRHNFGARSELTGIGAARLFLTGQGSGVDSLDGNGRIDVPYTKGTRMYNLPLLLDLIKFLGLRWPDRTAFEEAHALFSIRGQRVNIDQLDLLGNVVSLYGRGEVNLDGTDVQLDFYPSWARVEQVLPPVVRSIPPAVSKNLLKIEVRGKVTGNADDVKFHKKPVPALLDPLLQMRDRVLGKPAGKDEERLKSGAGDGR